MEDPDCIITWNHPYHEYECVQPAMEEKKSEEEQVQAVEAAADPAAARDWSALPADIVGLISGHLVLEENIFRAVCKSWQSAPTYPPPNYSDPWLFYMRKHQNRCCCRVISPFGRRSLDIQLPSQLAGCEIRGSRNAWLLFERDLVNLILFNPLSREIFDAIPEAPTILSNIWFQPPSAGGEVCTIVGLRAYIKPIDIGIWKFGEEKWRVYCLELENPDHELSGGGCTLTRLGKFFYVMGPDGGVGVFNPDDVVSSFCHWNISVPMHNSSSDEYFAAYYSPCYLVDINGQLLWSVFETIPDRTIRIFSLNLKKQRWKEVHHLGDRTLFLSNGRCFSKLLPITKLRNKIFFPKFADDMSYMLYCPLTKKFSSLNGQLSTCTALDLKNFHCASWFTYK